MPQDYVGTVMTLCNVKRGIQMNMAYHGKQVMLTYELPLAEIVLDFFDKLKSVTRGYASMDYEFKEYRAADVVKVDILINGDRVDPLAMIVHRSQSQYRGRAVAAKMRELIPRQMYDVAIQAAIGANIIAREDGQGAAQERAGKMLRRRHHPQAQAAREAEGRQEAHEADRHRRGAAGGLPGHPAGRRLSPGICPAPPLSPLPHGHPDQHPLRLPDRLRHRLVPGQMERQLLAAAVHSHPRHFGLLARRAFRLPAPASRPPPSCWDNRTPPAAPNCSAWASPRSMAM
jgi:hypothetical protein